jgi:YebC/PmpR family DNA-binding regulatory protein
MSGHSRWSQIKHKKAITDSKKSQLFGKIAKIITIAARDNPDPSTNQKLKTAIEQARSFNMPNDNIDRVLKRASTRSEAQLYELTIEAIGPGNASLIITAITDNKNRTFGEIKTLLSKNNGRIVQEGSVSWMFKKMGVIQVVCGENCDDNKKEQLELAIVDIGIEDLRRKDETIIIYTKPESLYATKNAITKLGVSVRAVNIEFIPNNLLKIPDTGTQAQLEKLYSALDDHDDVQEIFSNHE